MLQRIAVTTACLFSAFLISQNASGGDAKFSILFGGDTSFGENYQEETAAAGGENILKKHGYNYSISHLAPLMRSADWVILNLETPLTTLKTSPYADKTPIHWSDPNTAPAKLKEFGVRAVSLGNNHAMDVGPEGLTQTLASLTKHDLPNFGAGPDLAAAERPYRKTIKIGGHEFNFAIIGGFEFRPRYEGYGFYASDSKPGVNCLDAKRLSKQIAALKAENPKPYVIVFPHWGDNYTWRSTEQQTLGHQMIDAGADLVIGHGAHCLQEIEQYANGWIFYSIGNFMFNSDGRYKKLNMPPFSLPLVLDIQLTDGQFQKSVRLYPILSDNIDTKYQPGVASDANCTEVKKLLTDHSTDAKLGNELEPNKDKVGPYLQLDLGVNHRQQSPIPTGASSFQYIDSRGNSDRPITVWTFKPNGFTPADKVVFVMHGQGRNGKDYRDVWIPLAKQKRFLLLTPEFSNENYPDSDMYQQGFVHESNGTLRDKEKWTLMAIEHLFDDVTRANSLSANKYTIYGHSGGGQFVHRLALLCPEARFELAIAANPGWYTLPDLTVKYPYGLKGTPETQKQLTAALSKPLVILLGEKDTDPNQENLRRTAEAMRQGKNRFERGHYFFSQAKQAANTLNSDMNWRLETVPNADHSNAKMAPSAANLIGKTPAAHSQE